MAGVDTLAITDGTTTVTLTDGVNYALRESGWAAAVAPRSLDELGGRGPFLDVEEAVTIDIFGTTLALALAAEASLMRLLDQATRYAAGDLTVAAVTVQIQLTGGAVLSALVLGGTIERPENYTERLMLPIIENVVVRFTRRGAWLAAAEAGVSSSAVNAGAVWSITLGSHPEPSPVALDWNIPQADATNGYQFGAQLLAVAGSVNDILVLEAEVWGGGGVYSATPVTNARGGSVLTFTPTTANTRYFTNTNAPPTGLSTPGDWAVFASVNDQGAFATQVQLIADLNTAQQLITPLQTIPAEYPATAGGAPSHAMLLGVLSIPADDPLSTIRLGMISNTGGASVAVIDYLVFIRLGQDTKILTFDPWVTMSPAWANATMAERVDHRLLSHITPVAQIGRSAGTKRTAIGTQGDLILTVRGTTLAGIWMAAVCPSLGSGGFTGIYRATNQAGTLHSATFTATRRKSYLTAQ